METVKFKNPVIMDVKTLIMDRVSRGTDCLVTVVCHWTWGDTRGDKRGHDGTWGQNLGTQIVRWMFSWSSPQQTFLYD